MIPPNFDKRKKVFILLDETVITIDGGLPNSQTLNPSNHFCKMKNIFLHSFKKLEKANKSTIILLGLLQILVLGFFDYATGYELSFSVFYLLPVTFIAWYAEKRTAIVVSILSAFTWQFCNDLAGEIHSNFLISLWNTTTRIGFFIIIAILLTKLKQSYAHQKNLARTDYLTGAENSRSFYNIVQMEINRSRRYHRTFSLAYFDADNFKTINDTLGHHVGSDLLVRVVKIIKETLRSTDTIARIGGDEFAILLPETDEKQARFVIEKLQKNLLLEMQKQDWEVTFSIGVITYIDAPETVDKAIKLADELMYDVKKSGKNSVKYRDFCEFDYTDSFQEPAFSKF